MTKRVLIVDDEEPIIDILKIIMEKQNYSVVSANNGKEALNIVKEYDMIPNNDLYFDCIITDIVMPVMNGLDLMKKILDRKPHQKFLVVTAFRNSRELYELIEEKPNLMNLYKPFGFDDVVEKIQKLEEIAVS